MGLWKRSTRGRKGLWGVVWKRPTGRLAPRCGISIRASGAAQSVGTGAKPLKTPLLYFGLRIAVAGTANAVALEG
jgi:hypothetical protein